MIINFNKLVLDSGLISGREMLTIKDLICHFLNIKDLFIKVVLNKQLPDMDTY